jgi:hypothetical protein
MARWRTGLACTLVGVLVAGCAGARSTWRIEVTEYSPTEGTICGRSSEG